MLISAYELSQMIRNAPQCAKRLNETVAKGYGYVSMSHGTYSDLLEVLDYPAEAVENYIAWLNDDNELTSLRDACRHKYEAIKSGTPNGEECWQRVIDALREMRRDRKALGLEVAYWDVG